MLEHYHVRSKQKREGSEVCGVSHFVGFVWDRVGQLITNDRFNCLYGPLCMKECQVFPMHDYLNNK